MKLGISTFVTDESMSAAALARAAEERGFDALFLAEHSHIPVSRETPYPLGSELPRQYFRAADPFVALAAAASVTTTLRLGTGVSLLVQRDVIHTAKAVASLDLVSGGRVIYGVGVGWNREEMRNHGTDPRTRGRLLDERIEALRAIWKNDEASYSGQYVRFDPIFSWPKPSPLPPVYIGGNSEAAADRARRLGDGWLPNAVRDPAQVPAQLALVADTGLPVTATSAPPDERLLAAYAEAGAERVTFSVAPAPEADTLRRLDELAPLLRKVGRLGTSAVRKVDEA
ncbi:putative F420-dependent oxidoreductase [Amycolatopsis bartoniae]|uniref:LLM class F420-dependent oxidoreductase n=1 Tax=Amycolatopsis bartoniae TaxID=941986 RepID=A0A8H9J455_9PSEU|nr:LLM class F420-dependent oxidoreductase [Amycolatopsis bartoniae]MBB2937639.1 putative F420-dependent oxidoreductase [Amycolatopsis bartoniae]TVT00623.1 LLM class F420-dependent oxidoreductase [Amycolatopsis bartoniae]GHF82734.1 LLM class F420-dependent oxidoreductase [Amycolatopsis bartoniae]